MSAAEAIVDAVDLGSCVGVNGDGNEFGVTSPAPKVEGSMDDEGRAGLSSLVDSAGSTVEGVVYRLSFPDSSESEGSG